MEESPVGLIRVRIPVAHVKERRERALATWHVLRGELKVIREIRGVSTYEMAELCGHARSGLYRIEHGNRIPQVDTLLLMLDVLGCELIIVEKQSKNLDEGVAQ